MGQLAKRVDFARLHEETSVCIRAREEDAATWLKKSIPEGCEEMKKETVGKRFRR